MLSNYLSCRVVQTLVYNSIGCSSGISDKKEQWNLPKRLYVMTASVHSFDKLLHNRILNTAFCLINSRFVSLQSACNTFDEIPSRDPLWGQNVTCKIFPESELWFSHNLDFCVWEWFQFWLIMMSTKGLILRYYMAENSKNVNTSQNKPSINMIFQGKIANQHREGVLKFKITRYVILTLF